MGDDIYFKRESETIFIHNVTTTIPVKFDKRFVEIMLKIIPIGFENRVPGTHIAKFANKRRLTNFPLDGNSLREMLYFLMSQYGFPIGVAQGGFFIITSLKDKKEVFKYLHKYKLGMTTKYDEDGKQHEVKTKKLQFYEKLTLRHIVEFRKYLKKHKKD